jgi:pyruvate formate lyase activating enzyme
VKVSGYSAVFVELPEALQNDIIGRTEFFAVRRPPAKWRAQQWTAESKATAAPIFQHPASLHGRRGLGVRQQCSSRSDALRWCHNPKDEPVAAARLASGSCIGARNVQGLFGRLTATSEGLIIERRLATPVGTAVRACPAAALEVIGTRRTVDEVAEIVLRDRVFYETSGGGLTLSGGEPSMQAPFAMALMEVIHREGVHIALDTCGGVKWRRLAPLVKSADLVLYDLEAHGRGEAPPAHGHSSGPGAGQCRRIAAQGTSMWVQTPIIPGYTDDDANVIEVARFVRENLRVERWDLLLSTTCGAKYRQLGYPLPRRGIASHRPADGASGRRPGAGTGLRPLVGDDCRQESSRSASRKPFRSPRPCIFPASQRKD